MKLFRHYKNKPYTYVGVAKHSETLEDLVVYETRYDNPRGRLWVRPQKMFFESVTIDGQERARFEKVQARVETFEKIDEQKLAWLSELMTDAFGEWLPEEFQKKIAGRQIFGLVALVADEPIGFKLGYRVDDKVFYSWLGGVKSSYRRLGLATELLKEQHKRCLEKGFSLIRMKSKNQFREMIVLALRHGFDITGLDGEKIILEKKL
jgi:GNAT superfamily N-acetyltransferase